MVFTIIRHQFIPVFIIKVHEFRTHYQLLWKMLLFQILLLLVLLLLHLVLISELIFILLNYHSLLSNRLAHNIKVTIILEHILVNLLQEVRIWSESKAFLFLLLLR